MNIVIPIIASYTVGVSNINSSFNSVSWGIGMATIMLLIEWSVLFGER